MWPNRVADGNNRTCTPGIVSDFKENEYEESQNSNNNSTNKNNTATTTENNFSLNNQNQSHLSNIADEFPMLDELDRLAKMSKFHTNGQLIKQDWLDRLTLKEIQKSVKNEKEASKFFFLTIDLAQIKCDDTKYNVLYYEEVMNYKSFHFIYIY